jgi:hypothetical protein
MTISVPFQTIPIGIDRGVPSNPMKASLAAGHSLRRHPRAVSGRSVRL